MIENTMINMSPTRKLGRLKPRMEPAMIARPAMDLGLSPAQIPSGRLTTVAITIAAKASSSVAGKRWRISLIAGSL